MCIEQKRLHLFSRQPLSIFGTIAVGILLCSAVLCTLLRLSIGGDADALFIVAAITFICAVLTATGVRWTPLLGVLMTAGTLFAFYKQPFVAYHLAQPKIDFGRFALIVTLIATTIIGLGTSSAALLQNYLRRDYRTPRWLASALTGIAGMVVGAILIGAISQGSAASANTATSYTNGVPTVHMNVASFLQSSVTISKGSKLLLVDDGSYNHLLSNGSWVNDQPQVENQAGEPTVDKLAINGQNVTVGPFAAAGTYHIYCSLHRGMTLTVLVQ